MLAVKKFLFCFELETGGQIIGYIKALAGLALMVTSGSWFGRLASIIAINDSKDSRERESNHLLALTSLLAMLISFWVIFSSYELIQGCRQRKSSKIKAAIAQSLGFSVILLSLLLCGLPKSGSTVILELYVLLILYSLFKKLKMEPRTRIEDATCLNAASESNNADSVNVTVENFVRTERSVQQEAPPNPQRYSALNKKLGWAT